MFLDQTIIDIFRRSGNMTDDEFVLIMTEYSMLVMEAISIAGIDYYIEKENVQTYTPKQIEKVITKIYKNLNQDPKLLETVNEELERLNLELLDYFKRSALPGDVMYLKVYLASKINQFKGDSNNQKSLNLLKEISSTPKDIRLSSKLKLSK